MINYSQTIIETKQIDYHTSVLQGKAFSQIIFILPVNLYQALNGYKMGKPTIRNTNISHLFFVDNLKIYTKNLKEAKLH